MEFCLEVSLEKVGPYKAQERYEISQKQLYGLTHFLQITLLIVTGTYISPESYRWAQ